ncbi:hypothetical protein [Streptomyces sp. NBC_00443]|uniref:hypothetical protein n=1 Tax=Streptomyces sp. NBC_00443 TaxID=2975743 RepID=UPI003FA6C500
MTGTAGQNALKIPRGRAPHAVVLDGMLPDLDGLQVLRGLLRRAPLIHTARGLGYAIRPVEDGR